MKAAKEIDGFSSREGRSPTIHELAERLGVEVSEAAQAVNAGQRPMSLTCEEENGGQLDIAVEGEIVYFRYFKSETQAQTAERLGMTQVQISRREKVILQQLRKKLS